MSILHYTKFYSTHTHFILQRLFLGRANSFDLLEPFHDGGFLVQIARKRKYLLQRIIQYFIESVFSFKMFNDWIYTNQATKRLYNFFN